MAEKTAEKTVPVKKDTTKKPAARGGTVAPAETTHPLVSLRQEMDRLFERFASNWPRFPSFEDWKPFKDVDLSLPFGDMMSPKVDVSESKDAYEITAELPGLDEKDIEVTVANGSLLLKGEKRDERTTKEKDYHISERSYGMFKRSFRIPEAVDTDKISAGFKKGILTVSLPKTSEARSKQRKIAVKGG
jgi:HSP20 family protein